MEQLTPVVPQAHEGDASSSEARCDPWMSSNSCHFRLSRPFLRVKCRTLDLNLAGCLVPLRRRRAGR